MRLYLLRHADAEPVVTSDAARELTAKGVEQAKRVGDYCKSNALVPDLVITSPYRRAEQTARLVAEQIGANVKREDFLSSGMDASGALKELAVYTKLNGVMIVGHEPDFSVLIAALVGVADSRHLHVRKASLTLLELSRPEPGTATLEFSIPVGLMQAR